MANCNSANAWVVGYVLQQRNFHAVIENTFRAVSNWLIPINSYSTQWDRYHGKKKSSSLN